jgi:hypothetical protein
MATEKSTTEIRMIAQDVVANQERVCRVTQSHLEATVSTLAETVQANSKAISDLTRTVAVLAETIKPLPKAIQDNEAGIKGNVADITRLKGRPAVWAALGAALPTLLGVLLWWFSK